jgi:hypothetical protein
MKIKEIINSIKGVFKLPVKKYYFGKIKHGCPYFYPTNFSSSIIKIRKVTKKTEEEISKLTKWQKEQRSNIYNLPMVLRSKYWVLKLFNSYYWIELGFPISFRTVELGWKDKWNSPRFEWSPSFQIYFFKWQFCVWWTAPCKDEDNYWEMILWYLNYADKDITKAEKTWGWQNYNTKESTWNKECLI